MAGAMREWHNAPETRYAAADMPEDMPGDVPGDMLGDAPAPKCARRYPLSPVVAIPCTRYR